MTYFGAKSRFPETDTSRRKGRGDITRHETVAGKIPVGDLPDVAVQVLDKFAKGEPDVTRW